MMVFGPSPGALGVSERSFKLRIGMVVDASSACWHRTSSGADVQRASLSQSRRSWWTSIEGHMVDALASGGDEGRRSLR